MKTAEEVADELIHLSWDSDTSEILKGLIVKALTAYADERVKKALEDDKREFVKGYSSRDVKAFQEKSRAEALEEAANISDKWENTGIKISSKIRALKDNP